MGKSKRSVSIEEKISVQETSCKPTALNLLLADIIFVFHCVIILFVLFAPFTNIPAILILHIVFAISLMVHWNANSNVCSLSILEAHLRGLDGREETFTHKFIAPVYDISSTEWSNIVWMITFVVFCISIYKLYNTDKFKTAWKCIGEMESSDKFGDKFFYMLNCIKPLFIME